MKPRPHRVRVVIDVACQRVSLQFQIDKAFLYAMLAKEISNIM